MEIDKLLEKYDYYSHGGLPSDTTLSQFRQLIRKDIQAYLKTMHIKYGIDYLICKKMIQEIQELQIFDDYGEQAIPKEFVQGIQEYMKKSLLN